METLAGRCCLSASEADVPRARARAPARQPACRRDHAGAHRRASDSARQAADLPANGQQAPSDPPRDLQLQPFPGSARALGRRGEPRDGYTNASRRGPGASRGLHRRADRGAGECRREWDLAKRAGVRRGNTEHLRHQENRELAELLRVAAYTGLRIGELVALRWADVAWSERLLIVRRALSGTEERSTKSRRIRYVPLADQATAALDRLPLKVAARALRARC
ncbi:MAG: tyrosine-type recombinase/integrase [Nocardioidaceae bacterium]|nr:tyrosine-type recombinase/integrase [Nocardioidaceae bacterium]